MLVYSFSGQGFYNYNNDNKECKQKLCNSGSHYEWDVTKKWKYMGFQRKNELIIH